jgi:heme oxygenase (biliverdin-IX-beta and delta-forming)
MNTEILITLKNATWPMHKRLETNLNLLNPSFSLEDYRRLIKAFWGYYRPFEASLTNVPELHGCLPDIAMRSKLSLLETDLQALGVDVDLLDRLPVCHELPACNDLASALGCLYVLEGSTLGGQVISRHFKSLLNLDVENGAAFFTGYGEQTGAMWQTFRAVLMAVTVDEDALVHAACETFTTLERWLCSAIILSDE